MKRALTVVASGALVWGLAFTGAATAETTYDPIWPDEVPKHCTSDGPDDVMETDGSDAPEGDGSDAPEDDWSDKKDGRADWPEHQTSGQPDDDGSTDPEGAPDLPDGSADKKDGYLDLPDYQGDPDGEDGPDSKDDSAREDGRLDLPEYQGDNPSHSADDDDNKEGSLDEQDGRVDLPENKKGQTDDNGMVDPEGYPDREDGAADKKENDGSDEPEKDGSDSLEPEDCENDNGDGNDNGDDNGNGNGDDNGDHTMVGSAGIAGEACESGGVAVVLDNSQVDSETEYEIAAAFGDQTETKNVTVPAGETKTVVAPAPTDVQGTITVSTGGKTILEEAGTLVCGTDDDGFPTGDDQGTTEVQQKGSQLPLTGSSTGLIALIAGGLLAAGAATLGGLRLARNRS